MLVYSMHRRSLSKYFICDFCPHIFNEILQILRIFHELMHLFCLLCVKRKLNTQKYLLAMHTCNAALHFRAINAPINVNPVGGGGRD